MPKLTLTQDEIVQAIRKSVGDMGFKTEGKVINVVLTAGRKGNGHTADVEILDAPVVVPPYAIRRGAVETETVQVATEAAEVQLVEETVTEVAVPVEEETVAAQAVETDDLFQEG